jgi:hypothetical protein
MIQDCSAGCGTVPLAATGTDISIISGAQSTVMLDLGPNLCAKLTTPSVSQSHFTAGDSSWKTDSCQVFENANPYDRHQLISVSAAGVAGAWVRIETDTSTQTDFCALTCAAP